LRKLKSISIGVVIKKENSLHSPSTVTAFLYFCVINDATRGVIRATDEIDMLKEVSQIIAEIGGYGLAWVGYAENDNEKTIRPIYTADVIAHQGVLDKRCISSRSPSP